METEVKGPITNEVLRQAEAQQDPANREFTREIKLLWERVNQLADERKEYATRGQVLTARQVSAVRHAKLAQQVESLDTFTDELNDRFDNAVENAEDYRGALRTIVTALANGTLENAGRLDKVEARPAPVPKYLDPEFENLPRRSLWDTIKGWG